jgi:hypothetical protein
MGLARSFRRSPRSRSASTLPALTLARRSTTARQAQGRKPHAAARNLSWTRCRGPSVLRGPRLTKGPSSTMPPRLTKDPSTKRLWSRNRLWTACTRVAALVIRWTRILAAQSLPQGSPSRSRCSGRVIRLDRRSTRTACRSLGTNQRSRWLGRRECQRTRRCAVLRLTKDLRKTSSGRSHTHPGHASSPERPRARTLVRRRSRAATRHHRKPSWSSLGSGNHRSRRSRCRDQLLRRPPPGPRETDPATT